MRRIGVLLIVVTVIAVMAVWGDSGDDGSSNHDSSSDESVTLTIHGATGGVIAVNNATVSAKSVLTYDVGAVVSVNATPESGYQFVRWTGDVYTVNDVRASETIITMIDDYSLTADFEMLPPVQYTLNIIGPVHGSVTSPGQGIFFLSKFL